MELYAVYTRTCDGTCDTCPSFCFAGQPAGYFDDEEPPDDEQPAGVVTPEPSEEARDFLRRAERNPAFRGMIERLGEE